jgi:putative membrane protein
MFCLLIALIAGAVLLTVLRTRHGAPPWAPRPAAPEDDARRTLADRFARGDITVEEFMERASALNWNPGKDDTPRRGRR